jgi:hypothetical protein
MTRNAVFSLALLLAVTALNAQEAADPASSPSSSEMGEPDLPIPDLSPQEPGADLLPKSDELPAVSPKPVRTSQSGVEAAQTEVPTSDGRFEEVRLRAMDSPRAAYLLKRAQSSSHAASRRAYLREYYITLAYRMRKLDPKLRSSINAYEESKIREISGSSPTERPPHRSGTRHVASHEPHRRSHRITSRYQYRRQIEPYGPDYPPYYGPQPPWYPYPW